MLRRNYFGFVKFDVNALETKAKTEVQTSCQAVTNCEYKYGVAALQNVLNEIGDGHTFRLTPLRRAEFEANSSGQPLRGVGLRFAPLPDAPALVVTRVLENSPAAKAGIRRGETVWAVNGSLARFGSAAEASEAVFELQSTADTLVLELRDSQNRVRNVALKTALVGPWLPSLEFRDDVAVITFYQYLTPGVAARIHDHVRSAAARNAKAIVLDVRGSGGGSAFESLGSAGAFVQSIGYQSATEGRWSSAEYRDGRILSANNTLWNLNAPTTWNKPVMVLTNKISRSAAEYMTYFLQRSKRAQVIGERTAGVLNTATSIRGLPDGSSLAVTSARSSTLDGVPHPEFVTPDLEMLDDMAALSQGRDLILERALNALRTGVLANTQVGPLHHRLPRPAAAVHGPAAPRINFHGP
jgi:carboxyl-terminal processing protease